jgi:prepilin-type N-terminal cleavage/methylation domain-containing protein
MKNFFFKKSIRDLVSSVRGFTLIETLVSVFIITVVVLGPLTVAVNASSYAKQTKDTMIATYLAQEAIELLRHQQDSVYVRCLQESTDNYCELRDDESPKEAAWRIFRDRLGYSSSGASCYLVDNPQGCAYDFIDMSTNQDLAPAKYSSVGNDCSSLSVTPGGVYVCTGVNGSPGDTLTSFNRSVSVVSLPTFTGPDQDYNDDLRVTVTITFIRSNGYTRHIKVVDFLHARS